MLSFLGACLFAGGIWLAVVGGSFYYCIAGIGCIFAGIQIFRRRTAGLWAYFTVFVCTLLWAIGEVGMDFWQLVPRVIGPMSFAGLLALPWIAREFAGSDRAPITHAMPAAALGGAILMISAFIIDQRRGAPQSFQLPAHRLNLRTDQSDDWPAYGRTIHGTRYSPANEITADNVSNLQIAWIYHTGDSRVSLPRSEGAFVFETTPLRRRPPQSLEMLPSLAAWYPTMYLRTNPREWCVAMMLATVDWFGPGMRVGRIMRCH
jgi:glucose dehydrogenase